MDLYRGRLGPDNSCSNFVPIPKNSQNLLTIHHVSHYSLSIYASRQLAILDCEICLLFGLSNQADCFEFQFLALNDLDYFKRTSILRYATDCLQRLIWSESINFHIEYHRSQHRPINISSHN